MSKATASYPASVKLYERSPESLTVESLVASSDWRRYFGALSAHYSQLLSDTLTDAHLVAELGEVTYLIDTDVISNLAQASFRDNRLHRESLKLFENKKFRYALPLGAFHELIEWLRTLVPDRTMWADDSVTTRSLGREETVREIAQVFNVSDNDTNPVQLMDRLSSIIGSHRLIVERLTDLLTRPNFQGVVADYDLGDVAQLHSILGVMERTYDPERSRIRRDFHDAVNLALVCRSSRARANPETEEPSHLPSYILITQTQVLLDLVDKLRDFDDDSLNTLSALLGMRVPVVEGLFPVFSPRRAFIVEDIRDRYGLDEVALTKLGTERSAYQDLGDALRSVGSGYRHHPSAETLQLASNRLQRPLRHLMAVYSGGDTFFRQLEHYRAIEASFRQLEERHTSASEVTRRKVTRIRREAESFFKVLNRLHVLVDEMAVTSYRMDRVIDEGATFEAIKVYSDNPPDLILEGEAYLGSFGEKNYQAYSFRWPSSSTERKFFSALSNIIRPLKCGRSADRELKLQPVGPFAEHVEGLLVFTSIGAYLIPFEAFPRRLTLRQISLKDLAESVRRVHVGVEKEFVLEAIRVCTPFADFQMDLASDEGGNREVFVISHCNIGEQISYLCERTSLFSILPRRLNTVLQELTGQLPAYQPPPAGGGND